MARRKPKPVEGASPSLRSRELGQKLRDLRKKADLTAEDVADQLRCSLAKISHMELGKRPATLRDIRDLGILFKIPKKEYEDLERLAREARQRGWWEAYGEVPYSKYISYEAEAVSLRSYQSLAIPGLLQTDGYALAVNQGTFPDISAEEVDQLAKVRAKRQALLNRAKTPLPLTAIMDEATLHRRVGSPEVMAGQLRKLIEVSELPNVRLQVLPYELGSYPGTSGQFVILELAMPENKLDVVYVESLAGDLYIDGPTKVARYTEVFGQLAELALSPQDTRALIERRLKE